MTYEPALYYGQLKRKLWLGTLPVNILLAAWVGFTHPDLLPVLFQGMAMGVFYLWSLTFSAENPKKTVQFAFSVMRIWMFAYIVVQISHGRLLDLAIVMSGLLSYKVILVMEYVAQALSFFRKRIA